MWRIRDTKKKIISDPEEISKIGEEPEKEEIEKDEPKEEEREGERVVEIIKEKEVEKKYDKNNLEKAKKLFENVHNFGTFGNANKNLKVSTEDQVSAALNAIKNIGTAAGCQNEKSRKTFLGTVAEYLGIDEKKLGSLQDNVYNGDNKLKGKYKDNDAAKFVMYLRNLIAYGLDYDTGDAMPDIDLFTNFSNKIQNLKNDWNDLSNILKKIEEQNDDQAYKISLNVINGFEVQYDSKKPASDNFKNFQSAIEKKCKNDKIYLVLFGELFKNLQIICEAVDNKTGKNKLNHWDYS